MGAKAVAIIPARLGSTRFPRKALAAETGTALVVHVCERAAAAGSIGRVVVACDAEEIAAVVRAAGFEAVLTSMAHENGTSRLHEAASELGLAQECVVVNVQGDEPEIDPEVIDGAVAALVHGRAAVGTVAAPFGPGEDPVNPNIVKAVVALPGAGSIGRGLYFSRAVVPHRRDGTGAAPLKHVGIYAYRVATLGTYTAMAPTPLERTEQLEQLRWLEHGHDISVAVRPASHHGIDTPEQYGAFVARWRAANG